MSKTTNRKEIPAYEGFIKYFPDAIMEVAHTSYVCNQQHNPGTQVHWDREKSGDELDAMIRHLTDHASGQIYDTDGVRHLAKMVWRALAALQKAIELDRGPK